MVYTDRLVDHAVVKRRTYSNKQKKKWGSKG